jgi:Outer membrane protein and related peptidoglycan-associated (lipo)proteins
MRLATVLAVLSLWGSSSSATVYSSFLEDGAWATKASVFSCRMVHSVPLYGDAVFETRAGEGSRFYLQGDISRLRQGPAALVARSPIWAEQPLLIELAEVQVKQARRALELPTKDTERMLAELYDGLELVVTRDTWYGGDNPAQVAITTIGFRDAYQQYRDCLAGLLPANFDQIKRTSVYFGSSKFDDIPASELRKLDNIAAYVKADPSVREFFIDGHTDSYGSREENLQLAEKRTEQVTRYLINKGVPQEAITARWHGERYPIASNATPEGRAKNRRVTIRLEKLELKRD